MLFKLAPVQLKSRESFSPLWKGKNKLPCQSITHGANCSWLNLKETGTKFFMQNTIRINCNNRIIQIHDSFLFLLKSGQSRKKKQNNPSNGPRGSKQIRFVNSIHNPCPSIRGAISRTEQCNGVFSLAKGGCSRSEKGVNFLFCKRAAEHNRSYQIYCIAFLIVGVIAAILKHKH